jgi:DNA-binding NarL/FixJ family response regulator
MAITILIVDDHPTFRTSAKLLLESEGFEVVGEADDGGSAIEKSRELAPDVILLDVQLPDMDGFEVASEIAKQNASPAVILTSSHERGDFGTLVGACGARGFVTKADLSGASVRALLKA